MFHRKFGKAILLPVGIFLSITAVIVIAVFVLHVRMALDADSVWNYRLVGIDRWDSYVLLLSDSELWWGTYADYWSTERLELARKEIYARHGMIFEDQQIQGYFENCNWYNGTVPEAEFDDSVLNEYESANVKRLTHYISERES